jgi:antitoxin component of RelBE/YafQ-DinJ toxin-antitoxin module
MDATITIRTNAKIKKIAKARAKELGLSLSDILNNSLRRFAKGEEIVYDDDYSEEYITKLLAARDQALADYRAGRLKGYTPDKFVQMLRRRTERNKRKNSR